MIGRRFNETRRQRDRVLVRFSVLPDDSAAQPSLPAGDLGQGDAAELHDHVAGSAGPAARHRGRQGEAGAGGEEERTHRGKCGQQEETQRDRGRNSSRPVDVGGIRLSDKPALPSLILFNQLVFFRGFSDFSSLDHVYLLCPVLSVQCFDIWLGDRKCIRPVRNLAPAIPKDSLFGDLRGFGLTGIDD